MKTLEDLWYGNIAPHSRSIKKDSQAEKALSLVTKHDDALTIGYAERRIHKAIRLSKRADRSVGARSICRGLQSCGEDNDRCCKDNGYPVNR